LTSVIINTINRLLPNTDYITQTSRIKLGWIIGNGFVFRTDLNHQLYSGLSDNFNQNFLLWNMSIGKKIFKNQLGEINISAFDILKQNNSISRNITEIYIEDLQTQTLTRFFMLNFIYNFRNFRVGKPAEQDFKEKDKRRDGWW